MTLQDACNQIGIEYKDVPSDGKRYDTPAIGKDRKNTAGRIKLFSDGKGGIVSNWINAESLTFWYDDNSPARLTAEQQQERVERIAAAKQQEEAELAECRKRSAELWEQGRDVKADHPYLVAKNIKPYGVKQLKESLMIPVRDAAGTLHGLQFIDTGSKKFKTGTAVTGCYHAIGKPNGKLLVAEGFATSAALHEITGIAVAVAFNAGNLKTVAEALRAKLPDTTLIICADDDHATDGNPGLTKATEAARAVNGLLAVPSFPDTRSAKETDFQDMARLTTPEAVKVCIDGAAIPATNTEDSWPEPVLFGEIETPDIPTTLLPEPLAAYCNAVVESTQTPPGMAVMMGLSAVSACIQKRFEVCPFGDNYTEPVNLMTVSALDPASRKSAVVSAITLPLTTWEAEQAEALREQSARVRHQRDMVIKSIDSIKSKASKPDSTDNDRREALAEIRRLEDSMPPEIITPRLWIDDVTPERLQSLMADNGERIAVISAEGGIFEVIAGLYNGGKSNINVILQSHAGEPVRVERQGRSVTMLKPALTFGLTVQPDIIADLAAGNKARFRGNGMLARLLYCIPKSTVGSRDVTRRRPVTEKIKAEYHAMVYRLLAINPLSDESGRERPRLLTLAPEALKAWLTFSQYIESKQGQYGEFNSIQDWTGKLPGAALRIAGLCHVVEHGDKTAIVSIDTIDKALDLAELLIVHAKAAFAMMGSDPAIPDAKFILQWITRNGADSFRRGDLHKTLHGKFQRVDRLIKALQVLSERHIISEPENRPTGRRPEIVYTVNPAILKGGCNGMA